MDPGVRISNMDSLLFALTLEVVLLQMRILEGCTELRAQRWKLVGKNDKLQREKLLRDRSLKTIAEDLQAKRNRWKMELRDADRRIAVVKDKTTDDIVNANARLCYAEKWLLARAESLELECEVQSAPPPRINHEKRVHDELLKAYEIQIKELQKSLEYWQQRYTVDTAKINERLATKCEELRIATARRTDLQKLYNLHEGEMRAWLTFKRERAARLAREERLRKSATRIQAWWRGVMVRRALGAFRHLRNSKKSPMKHKKK